jgi:hypothetical protein
VQLFTRRGFTGPTAILLSQVPPPSYAPSRSPSTAVVSGVDGIAVLDALHRRRKATDAMPYAFDPLEFNGRDLRSLPLSERKDGPSGKQNVFRRVFRPFYSTLMSWHAVRRERSLRSIMLVPGSKSEADYDDGGCFFR